MVGRGAHARCPSLWASATTRSSTPPLPPGAAAYCRVVARMWCPNRRAVQHLIHPPWPPAAADAPMACGRASLPVLAASTASLAPLAPKAAWPASDSRTPPHLPLSAPPSRARPRCTHPACRQPAGAAVRHPLGSAPTHPTSPVPPSTPGRAATARARAAAPRPALVPIAAPGATATAPARCAAPPCRQVDGSPVGGAP